MTVAASVVAATALRSQAFRRDLERALSNYKAVVSDVVWDSLGAVGVTIYVRWLDPVDSDEHARICRKSRNVMEMYWPKNPLVVAEVNVTRPG